jgi:two-component system cell cycle response regulator
MNFIFATDGNSGIHAAYSYRPDIIICDYNMPKMKGDEFHDKIVSNPDFVSIPFIFLTAIAHRELIIERRKKGAIAVLQKPLEENYFLLTVENNLKRYMSYRKTLKQAIVDELTGLYNRPTILRKLHDQLAIRSYRNLSLIFFDIDHFKQFNDVYGHQAGDKVLATVGNTVKTTIRNSDIGGRYGGEEFLIILPETTLNGAFIVAKKLKEGINAIPVPLKGREISISSSFGISSLIENSKTICDALDIADLKDLYEVTDNEKTDWKKIDKLKAKIVELLISLADQAMYKAKSTICSSCGFASAEEALFAAGKCPRCKKKKIIKGRNKIVLWED